MQHAHAATATLLARDPFISQRTVLLTSYRCDGTPVGTPVHIAAEGDRAFVRTWDSAGKMKRIRNNPAVTVAPSTVRGAPTGPAMQARARILAGDGPTGLSRLVAREYPILHGFLIPLTHRLRGNRTMHIELTPTASAWESC